MGGSIEKRGSKDLGLVPKNSQEEQDLGLNVQDIQGASRVLYQLLPFEDVYVHPIAEIKGHLEKQLWFAQKRQDQDKKKLLQARRSRRKILKTAAIVGAFVGIPSALAALANLTSPSPETIAQNTEEKKRLQEKFEKSHTLGLTPSTISYSGWRIRYLPKKDDTKFREDEGRYLFTVIDGGYVSLPGGLLGKKETYIALEAYKKTDGLVVPKLKVLVDRPNRNNWEEWLLRDQSTEEIDNRVVVFENAQTEETKYAAITMAKSESPIFEVKLMRKI